MSARNDFGWDYPPGVCENEVSEYGSEYLGKSIEMEHDSYDEDQRRLSFHRAYAQWCLENPLPKDLQ